MAGGRDRGQEDPSLPEPLAFADGNLTVTAFLRLRRDDRAEHLRGAVCGLVVIDVVMREQHRDDVRVGDGGLDRGQMVIVARAGIHDDDRTGIPDEIGVRALERHR